MSEIGNRLREERESLRLSQAAFGEIGGVKANAQGKYESGERFPDAHYLHAAARADVDVLYVITGQRTPTPLESIAADEAALLACYRSLSESDRSAAIRLISALSQTADLI